MILMYILLIIIIESNIVLNYVKFKLDYIECSVLYSCVLYT